MYADVQPHELIGDLFAGGGGASQGIYMATGRHPDFAINHDPEAIALHAANHPTTDHFCADINEVDPRMISRRFNNRPLGLLWASPDCKSFSIAKGGKPRDKRIRSLAWIVVRYAAQLKPRMIFLENVPEYLSWGDLLEVDTWIYDDELAAFKEKVATDATPAQLNMFDIFDEPKDQQIFTAGEKAEWLQGVAATTAGRSVLRSGRMYKAGQPDPRFLGLIFQRWVNALKAQGYTVDWKVIVAADHGAPTTRKRLYLHARRDGLPILWPKATHAPRDKADFLGLLPWRAAAEIIDWSLPTPSIFTRTRPLESATRARIAKGIKRYVIEAANPFLVPVTHTGQRAVHDVTNPTRTITCANRGEFSLVAPSLVPRYGERPGQEPRCRDITVPYPTAVPDGNGGQLVEALLGGAIVGCGGRAAMTPPRALDDPLGTATTKADKCAAIATLAPIVIGTAFGDSRPRAGLRAWSAEDPFRVLTASNDKAMSVLTLEQARPDYLEVAFLGRQFGTTISGRSMCAPHPAVMTQGAGGKSQVVVAHLSRLANGSIGSFATDPTKTVTAKGKDALTAVYMDQQNGDRIGRSITEPSTTLTARSTQQHLAAVQLDKYYATGVPQRADAPLDTATTKGRFGINATFLEQANTGVVGHRSTDPVSTILSAGSHQRLIDCRLEGFDPTPNPLREAVLAFLWEHFGEPTEAERDDPLATPAGRLKFGLVEHDGSIWRIVDIGMRMLEPRELYGAQGFPSDYKINIPYKGKMLTKTAQTRMAGNSVCPDVAAAIIRVNTQRRPAFKVAA